MKFVIIREYNVSGVAHSWRLETDKGFVLAKSTRFFPTREKCLKELADLKRDAAITKIIER